MKKIEKDKYIAIVISFISIGIFFAGYQFIASFVALVGMFVIGFTKHKSGPFFIVASFINYAAIGFLIDYPIHGFPPAIVFLILIWITLNIRTWSFGKMYLYKAMKMEMILVQLCLAGLIISALLTGYKWQQWTAVSIPVLLYAFLSMVIYKDRNEARLMVEKMDIKLGSPAPDFTLEDQNGNPVSLKSVLATQHALVIFVRGDWCPTCHMMLRGYVKNKEKLAEKNVRIIGVGPDPIGVNKEIMSRIDDNSCMLADADQEIASKYSMALQENNPITKPLYKNGIPLPASFLIHQNGTIIYTSRSDKAAEILQPDKIFEVLESLK